MNRFRKGQSGVEFMAVTAIGLLMIVGVSLFLLGQGRTERDNLTIQQAHQAMQAVADQSNRYWSFGANSWVTVSANIPDGVMDIVVAEGHTLVAIVSTSGGVVRAPLFTNLPLAGTTMLGDINGDEIVDATDETEIGNYITGSGVIPTFNIYAADVTGDRAVTIADKAAVTAFLGGSNARLPSQSIFVNGPHGGTVAIRVTNNGTAIVLSAE